MSENLTKIEVLDDDGNVIASSGQVDNDQNDDQNDNNQDDQNNDNNQDDQNDDHHDENQDDQNDDDQNDDHHDENQDEQPQLTEESVLSYINEKLGISAASLADLSKRELEELPEVVAGFKKYHEETGRGIEDYMRIHRDYDTEPEDSILTEFMSKKFPTLSKEEISFKLKRQFGYNEHEDDDDEILEKKIARKEALEEAKAYLKNESEKYKAPLESSGDFVPPHLREEFNQFQQFKQGADERQAELQRKQSIVLEQTDKVFGKDFKGFSFKVGDESITYEIDSPKDVRDHQLSINNTIGKFLDKDGSLKDGEGYHKAIFAANNIDSIVKWAIELGEARAIENMEKERNNPNKSQKRHNPPTGGARLEVVE